MLKGADLLAKVKELGTAPRDELAIACGYVNKAGKPAYTAYYEALLEAKGVALPPASTARKPRAGKPLSWNVAVSKIGVIPVSAGYSSLLGLEPGDRVDIAHDAATGTLTLRKAAAEPVVVTEAAPVVIALDETEELTITAPAELPASQRGLVAAGERAPF
jgi:hypothetical protein